MSRIWYICQSAPIVLFRRISWLGLAVDEPPFEDEQPAVSTTAAAIDKTKKNNLRRMGPPLKANVVGTRIHPVFGVVNLVRNAKQRAGSQICEPALSVLNDGVYPKRAFKSASGVLIGWILNFSTRTFKTFGEMKAGRVGPR